MRILVTNDDGVESPGMVALARALHDAGHDVFVVAPASDLSGAAASIGPLHRTHSIPVVEHHWPALPSVPVLAIERPPATAVYAACLGGFGPIPDLVASGINPGANTGHLVLHSGTVGAALTAANLGVAGLAVSMKWSDEPYEWETAAQLAVAAVEWAAASDTAPVLNLNVPNVRSEHLLGVREATLARFGEVWVASADVRAGDLRMNFNGGGREPDPGSDAALLLAGYATVTPIAGIAISPHGGAATAIERARRIEHGPTLPRSHRRPPGDD